MLVQDLINSCLSPGKKKDLPSSPNGTSKESKEIIEITLIIFRSVAGSGLIEFGSVTGAFIE